MQEWGRRLSDALRGALAGGDLEAARRLVLEGDGQARSFAKEYTFMYRGLGITVRVLMRQLAAKADAAPEVAALLRRFRQESGATGALEDELRSTSHLLEEGEAEFEREQARLADETLSAIEAGDTVRALALVEEKERHYVPRHDRLVRFMADCFGWVLERYGPEELLRFHLASSEGQRAGFDKWERLSAAEFAWTSAFLLKQHMGRVAVHEDEEKFTIHQAPCGSGGRLQLGGAYSGPQALPFVETPGPLTFGEPRLPVYCSHCPVWNGVATLHWYGRPHWVFENPARPDGTCTMHIYKRRDGAPPEYTARLGFRAGG
jgi:hypothetical protein